MKRVNDLMVERNRINAQIQAIKDGIVYENKTLLLEEVLNFFDKVGEGYVDADYYAEERYYSRIAGVKNLRWGEGYLWVKIESPIGALIPDTLNIEGWDKPLEVKVFASSNYEERVDY